MEAIFKWPFIYKTWQVTDDAIIYGENQYLYSELEYFRITALPLPGNLVNGVFDVMTSNGKKLTCAFKYADKNKAIQVMDFVNEKIKEKHGIVDKYNYKLLAHTGTTLKVYDSYLSIMFIPTSTPKYGSISAREVKIQFDSITDVRLYEPSAGQVGFIQILYPGSINASNSSGMQMIGNENCVPLQQSMMENAKTIVEYIKTKINKTNGVSKNVNLISSADELLKFKELLDAGIITQEEFDTKKKQILGM